MTDRARRRRRRTNRRAGVAIGAVVLLATGVTVALTSVSHSATYRLATVVTGDARTGLGEVGTVRPVNQSAVAFPVNGRVSTVDVEPGRRVTAGQQLASLDTAAMSAQLAGAHAATAKAQAKLDADQASQAAAPSTGASASRLGALQRTLTGDQHLADRDLEHARAAVAQAAAACGPGARPAPRPTERPTSSPTGPDPPPPADACRRAEAEALDWEVASDRD